MSRIIVIGGSGVVGSVAVRTLAKSGEFSHIVVADIDLQKAQNLVSDISNPSISTIQLDATDYDAIMNAIKVYDVKL